MVFNKKGFVSDQPTVVPWSAKLTQSKVKIGLAWHMFMTDLFLLIVAGQSKFIHRDDAW